MKKLLLLLVLCLSVVGVYAQQDVNVESAFMAIVEAEEAGGDISNLVPKMNEYLGYLENGDDVSAVDAYEELTVLAAASTVLGVREGTYTFLVTSVVVSALLGLTYLTWRHFDEYFWRFWRYTRRGFTVEKP